jgi:aspartate aminotransferase/aminotransferase
MHDHWLATRLQHFQDDTYKQIFDLGKTRQNPINLMVGQPHFDVPEPIKEAAVTAIRAGRNGYTMAQGIRELRDLIQADVRQQLGQPQREVLIANGTLGALVLALECTINPGDEVVIFDPYFLSYVPLIGMVGGVTVAVNTYPDFQINIDKLQAVLTPKTKAIIVNSPANPTGVVQRLETMRALARLAQERGILLISDEIYSTFCFDVPFTSPAQYSEEVLVVSSFSKTHAMTGWRIGYAHGPRQLIDVMSQVQQFTFVCAPSMAQYAALVAWSFDMTRYIDDYRQKRNRVMAGIEKHYRFVKPEGAFYLYVETPWGTGTEFVSECIRNDLLVLPGRVFSKQDTHFRLSYAAPDEVLDRGIVVLNQVAKRGPT